MPRDQRRFREPPRNERENIPRYHTRVLTPPPPPGISRNRHEDREKNFWEKGQRLTQRSRSPRGERRRESVSDHIRQDSPRRDLIHRRSRERDMRLIHESSRHSEVSARVYDSKYSAQVLKNEKRLKDKPTHPWGDSSRNNESENFGHLSNQQYANNQVPDNPQESPVVIPEFNPETSKLNSKEWLELLEDIAIERGWKQDEKLYIMTSRLAGFARQWYLSAGINCKVWVDLKEAFLKAFPSELDYPELLSKMLKRVKDAKESLSTYFLHKVALLNECEIQGVKAVSCIIAGLSNPKMQQQAKLQKCEDPDQLYLFLRSLNEEDSNKKKSASKKEDDVPTKESRSEKWKGKKDCYFCGQPGHLVVNCRHIKRHKCSVCHEIGHECEPLYVSDLKQDHNRVMEGSLAHTEVESRNFTEVFINGLVLKAYVDFECESITIREDTAIEIGLPIKKQYSMVRGFAGASLSSVGYIDAAVYIDRAIANARLAVVSDSVQSIPVVVGQAFTSQPHVVTFKDGGRIRFYQRLENGETNFDF